MDCQKKIRIGDEVHIINDREASRIIVYLEDNKYVDNDGNITKAYKDARLEDNLEPLPPRLQSISDGVFKLINAIFDENVLKEISGEEEETRVYNKLNKNFEKEEFKALWNEINHRYVYTVHYDSKELIEKVVNSINANLNVPKLQYIVDEGEQTSDGLEFSKTGSRRITMTNVSTSNVKYDLVGDIAKGAKLTRKSIVSILESIEEEKLYLFKTNPETFIREVIQKLKRRKLLL